MKFSERITEIWNNEELDNDTKLATLCDMVKDFVPKAKMEEYSEKSKKIQQEFDDYKASKMTEEEKASAELENARIKANKTMVENLLLKAGLTDEDYTDDDVSLLAVSDEATNTKLANLFITSIKKSAEKAKQETTVQLLKETPKPEVGNPNGGTISNLDNLQAQLNKAIESKDELLQAQLYQQIALEQSQMNVQ